MESCWQTNKQTDTKEYESDLFRCIVLSFTSSTNMTSLSWSANWISIREAGTGESLESFWRINKGFQQISGRLTSSFDLLLSGHCQNSLTGWLWCVCVVWLDTHTHTHTDDRRCFQQVNWLSDPLEHCVCACACVCVCDWVNGVLMNVFVHPTLFLNEHSCTLSEFYPIYLFLFFFLRPVVCCYEWVLLHLQTKVCGTTKIKSPTRRPFMLDVTEEGLVPKRHRHFYHSVNFKGIHCVSSVFWSEDRNHLILFTLS